MHKSNKSGDQQMLTHKFDGLKRDLRFVMARRDDDNVHNTLYRHSYTHIRNHP